MPVVNTTSTARTNFYANESWWGQQRKRAKSIIYQTTPYSCAKLAKVLELRNPHFYYFVNGPQNCQVRNKIEFIIQTARWKQIEPHIKFIYPAAKLLAKSYIELLDLNCTNPDIRAYQIKPDTILKRTARTLSAIFLYKNLILSNRLSCKHHQHWPTQPNLQKQRNIPTPQALKKIPSLSKSKSDNDDIQIKEQMVVYSFESKNEWVYTPSKNNNK